MGVRLVRFPEYRLNLNIYSGAVSAVELFHHLRRLDSAADWLSYFDATADLSGIDLAHFPALKHAITAKEHERDADAPKRHALVNISEANRLFVRFWCSYVTAGVRNAHQREIFPTLEDACRGLGLPPGAQQAIAQAITAAEPGASHAPWTLRRPRITSLGDWARRGRKDATAGKPAGSAEPRLRPVPQGRACVPDAQGAAKEPGDFTRNQFARPR